MTAPVKPVCRGKSRSSVSGQFLSSHHADHRHLSLMDLTNQSVELGVSSCLTLCPVSCYSDPGVLMMKCIDDTNDLNLCAAQ